MKKLKHPDAYKAYACAHCLDRVLLAHMLREDDPRGPQLICVACAMLHILNIYAHKRLGPP